MTYKDPIKQKEAQARWYKNVKNNKPELYKHKLEVSKKWKQANKKKGREYNAKWRQDNPEKAKASRLKYAASPHGKAKRDAWAKKPLQLARKRMIKNWLNSKHRIMLMFGCWYTRNPK